LAGGHNGLSHGEDPQRPEDPFPRVHALRTLMRSFGLGDRPIIMAGNVWWLEEWEDWIDNPDLGPIAFQFGTRPLLTRESPIGSAWKQRLLTLKWGDVFLNRFSPTGFYSSAVNNGFVQDLRERSERQVPYGEAPDGEQRVSFRSDPRKREVYLTAADRQRADGWLEQGFTEVMPTPDGTLIFMTPDNAKEIRRDQSSCVGCLNECRFSTWSQHAANHNTGRKPDPRSYCIQKTLQSIAHESDKAETVEHNLMFSGHCGYRFATDPFYSNGFIPTVRQLIDRILTGR
jgi:nitronate monooxygenase